MGHRVNEITCEDEYLAESGDAEEDLALLQDMPSLPRLPWKLPCKEFDNGPGDAGDAVNGDFDLTESVLDLKADRLHGIRGNTELLFAPDSTVTRVVNTERFKQAFHRVCYTFSALEAISCKRVLVNLFIIIALRIPYHLAIFYF